MIRVATQELRKRGLDWKEDQMELISWGLYEDAGDLHIEDGAQKICDQRSGNPEGHGSADLERC